MRHAIGLALVLGVVLLSSGAAAQDCFSYATTTTFTGSLPVTGTIACAVADGDLVYLVTGTQLLVIDASDPYGPLLVGATDHAITPLACALLPDHLAVAMQGGGLLVFDVSDPAHPTAGATIATPGEVEDLAPCGDLLLAAADADGLIVLDASDPAQPVTIGQLTQTSTFVHGVAAVTSTRALAATEEALMDVSLADPTAPVYTHAYAPRTNPANVPMFFRVRVVSNYAVLAMDEAYPVARRLVPDFYEPHKLLVVDLTSPDPELPVVGIWEGDYVTEVGLDGVTSDRVLAHLGRDVLIFRLGEALPRPEAWQPILALEAAAAITTGAITTSSLSVAVAGVGVRTLPAAEPTVAQPIARFAQGQAIDLVGAIWAQSSTPHGIYANTSYKTYLWDLRDPVQPAPIDSVSCSAGFSFPHSWDVVTADGERVLAAEHVYSTTTWSLRSYASQPPTVASVPTPRATARFAGDLLLAIGGDWADEPGPSGVQVYDIADPAAPTPRGFLQLDDLTSVYGAIVAGTRLVAVSSTGQVHVVDVGDPDAPSLAGVLALASRLQSLRALDGLIVGVDLGGTLRVIDPVTVAEVGSVAGVGPVADLALQGDVAWALRSLTGLVAVDLSDPSQPTLAGSPCPLPGKARQLALGADVAYAACGVLGVQAIDIRDPAQPVLLGGGGVTASEIRHHAAVLVTDGAVLPPDCGEAVAVPSAGEAAPARVALTVWPNPFNPTTTVSFTAPVGRRGEVAVYDLRGRRVRQLARGHLAAGAARITWDGRGDDGRPLASGLYLVRIAAGEQSASAKVVLAR